MADLKKTRRGGFYWVKDKPYLSVTNILSVIDKPQLRYWFGKQVYLAMVANPTLSEKEAMSSPYQVSDKAKSRGTTVHSIVESYKATGEQIKVTPEYEGYAKAFYKWVADTSPKILEQEKTVFNETHKYAGTLDLLAKLNGSKKPMVIDVKTGRDIYTEAFIQTAAYYYCLSQEPIKILMEGTAILLLGDDGSYKFQSKPDPSKQMETFLACKKIYETLHEVDLKKVGYL